MIIKLSDLKVSVLDYDTSDLQSIYKHIEVCGRTCYKSENKITCNSCDHFVQMIKNNKHLSVLEHGTVYLYIPLNKSIYLEEIIKKLSKYSRIVDTLEGTYISTNMRCIVESGLEEEILQYIVPFDSRYHTPRFSLRVFAPISLTREANRHRSLSVSERSTRYVKFSDDQAIEVMKPEWYSKPNVKVELCEAFLKGFRESATYYNKALELGATKQMARELLPLGVMSEVVYTGFVDDWKHFLNLRTASGAHPDMKRLAKLISYQLTKELEVF